MADTKSDIANYDYLQFINSNFADLVSHYINMWQAYHQSFTQAAMNLCLWGGLAWVSLLTLKAPADRLKTAVSAFGVVMLVAMLLQPGSYKVGPAGGSVGLAAGAGWSLQIIGNIYQLFKSALDSVNKEAALDLAFDSAYHVTDEGTIQKFANSPVKEMYQDYIDMCQGAVKSISGSTPDTRAAGRAVGLFGSTGVNQVESQALSKEAYDNLKNGKKVSSGQINYVAGFGEPNFSEIVSDMNVAADVDKGRDMLAKIPEDANPFRGANKSYVMPSKEYWVKQYFPKKANEGVDEYEKVVDGSDNSMYSNPAYTDVSTTPPDLQARFYPKDCLQMYGMVSKAVSNWTKAIQQEVPMANQSSYFRDGREAQEQMVNDIQNMVEQKEKYAGTNLPVMGSMKMARQDFDWGIGNAATAIMTKIQDIGMKFKEWMLTFKIPTMINGCAMLAAILMVLFPIICVFAVFVNPSILISYVKMLCFAFMVPFINNMVLTMAATLLAMNNELMAGLNAGNGGQNYTLLISAGSAQYIIFMALTAVEIIIAKMLIWDDVKGLSGFNPAGAATGMAATGGAVVGAAVKLGSMALSLLGGPGKIAGAIGKGLGGAAGAAGGAVGAAGRAAGGMSGSYGLANTSVSMASPSKGSYSQAGRQLSMPKPSGPKPSAPKPSGSTPTTPPEPKKP